MALFEGEQIEDGVTLRVYRFTTDVPRLSIVVRMKGEKTTKGAPIVNHLRKELKASKKADLDSYKSLHKKPFFFKQKKEELDQIAKLTAIYNGDPLFDLSGHDGEMVVDQFKEELKDTGLTLKPSQRMSNGDLDEEILLFV